MRSLGALLVAGAMSILLIMASFSILSSWGASSTIGTAPTTGGTGTTPTGDGTNPTTPGTGTTPTGNGTNPSTPGNGTTPSNDTTPPRGNCPGNPNTINGTGETALGYRSARVFYNTTTGAVDSWACIETYHVEYYPSIANLCNWNGSSPGPGRACLSVSRDPNLDAFFIDAWPGNEELWAVDLPTLTLQRI